MRLLIALTLTALLAGCGDDEPEPAPTQQPEQPTQQQPTQQQPEQPAQPSAAEPAAREPAPDTAPEPEPGTRVGDQRLYTVQVAAFLNAVTAREWVERLRDQQIPVWTSTAEVEGRTFHRLRLGALPELPATYRLADRIRARYDWPVWVAPLTPSDRLPAGAVEQTRQALRAGQ